MSFLCKKITVFAVFFFTLLFSIPISAQEIGLQLYTFRNQIPKDVPGMLQKISAMGIRELEGGGTYNLSKEEFKQLLDKNNLRIVSYGASFEELQKDPQAVADKAKFFGSKLVVCTWVPHNGDVFTFEDTKKAVDVFNNAGKILKQNGLDFVYHAHGYEFQPYQNGTFFDFMVKNMNPAYANFEMDVFWFKNSGQDPAAWINKYPKRFKALHLKDRKHGTPDNVTAKADVETNVTLGSGDVNIAAVMKAAKKAGIRYYFIEDESSRSLEQVPESLAYLKKLK
ncbi:MAG: sugar phosphate isomerase/epimerase [Flavisolibacter sp.]|nr:sugar phosphate isomerase/epimerase [Flavisolibacter sp.]